MFLYFLFLCKGKLEISQRPAKGDAVVEANLAIRACLRVADASLLAVVWWRYTSCFKCNAHHKHSSARGKPFP